MGSEYLTTLFPDLKVGDVLECTKDNTGSFVEGNHYTVQKRPKCGELVIIDEEGWGFSSVISKFRRLEKTSLSEIKEALVPGTVVECTEVDSYFLGKWTEGRRYIVQLGDDGELGIVTDEGYFREARLVTLNKFKIVEETPPTNQVSHPSHYTSHPSGVECLEVTRHMSFNLGNAVKYIWRCDLKNDAIEDLEKAQFYIADEIEKRKAAQQ